MGIGKRRECEMLQVDLKDREMDGGEADYLKLENSKFMPLDGRLPKWNIKCCFRTFKCLTRSYTQNHM